MNGREELFNTLVRDYSERLYWHVRSLVDSHEDADDLMQEVFLKVWRALPSFRGDSAPFTWLWRIATNEALGFLRKRRLQSIFEGLGGDAQAVAAAEGIHDGDKAEGRLRNAIKALPDKQRTVFCMRYFEELPYETISGITGTSVGALKASYHFAAEKLKDLLSDD